MCLTWFFYNIHLKPALSSTRCLCTEWLIRNRCVYFCPHVYFSSDGIFETLTQKFFLVVNQRNFFSVVVVDVVGKTWEKRRVTDTEGFCNSSNAFGIFFLFFCWLVIWGQLYQYRENKKELNNIFVLYFPKFVFVP